MARLKDTRAEYRETMAHYRVLITIRVGMLSIFTFILGEIGRLAWEVYIANPDLVYNEMAQRFRGSVPWGASMGILILASVDRVVLRAHRLTSRRLEELEGILDIDGVHTDMEASRDLITSLITYEMIYVVALLFFGILTLLETVRFLW